MSNKSFSPNKIETYRVKEDFNIRAIDNKTLEFWTCKRCFLLVCEPKFCTKCENYFCNECIKKFAIDCNYKYECPNKCYYPTFRDLYKGEKEFINKIQLKCKHYGCYKFINYLDYKKHLETCEYRLYHCNNKSCNMQGYLYQMKDHSKKCQYQFGTCTQCKQKVRLIDEDIHFNQDCPQQVIKCPICNMEIKRCDYLEHQTKDARYLKNIENKLKENKNSLEQLISENGKYKALIQKQEEELNKLIKTKNILLKKNADKKIIIKELRQYFTNGFNKFNENGDDTNKVLKINDEIKKMQNQNQNNYQNTDTNFYKKQQINGRNTDRYNYTEKKNYDRGMRRINSEANFGYYRTEY